MFSFIILSLHHSDGDDINNFGFWQVGINIESIPLTNPTTSGVDEMDDAIISMVTGTKTKTGITFDYIVHVNHPPKSVARFNPILPVHNKPMIKKKQVARFMPTWWELYLDSCATYHTAFVKLMSENVADANTTLVGTCNAGVTFSSLKRYYGKFHMWVNNNGMANLLCNPCLE